MRSHWLLFHWKYQHFLLEQLFSEFSSQIIYPDYMLCTWWIILPPFFIMLIWFFLELFHITCDLISDIFVMCTLFIFGLHYVYLWIHNAMIIVIFKQSLETGVGPLLLRVTLTQGVPDDFHYHKHKSIWQVARMHLLNATSYSNKLQG